MVERSTGLEVLAPGFTLALERVGHALKEASPGFETVSPSSTLRGLSKKPGPVRSDRGPMLDSSVGQAWGCVMAMGQVKGQAATLQVEMVCLDELVPKDDRCRRLDRLVDWSFVRELAASYTRRMSVVRRSARSCSSS